MAYTSKKTRWIRLWVIPLTVMTVSHGGLNRVRAEATHGALPDSGTQAEPAVQSFHMISAWEKTTLQTKYSPESEPVEFVVERLCSFYGVPYDANSAILASRSPLEWPRVLASEAPDARRQRLEIRALLAANHLEYREIVPLDLTASDLADSLVASVATDHPVLLNSPDAALVYGYDRREPDHWWWFDRAGTAEIVLESERTPQFTMWSDDPAAGIAWSLIGSRQPILTDPDSVEWAFLHRVAASVQGVPGNGVAPYPLSLRNFRDLLESDDSLPQLAGPVSPSDPLGVLRAKAVREYLLAAIEDAVSESQDTTVSEPLRLSEYHVHSAIGALSQLATTLYGTALHESARDSLYVNWSNERTRVAATQAMTEVLKSERFALESLQSAVAAHDELHPQAPAKSRRRAR